MSAVYNGGGIYSPEMEIVRSDGTPPIAAVANGFFVAVLPVAGVRTLVTIAAQPDVPRNVTFLVTDADSGIAIGSALELYGTDAQDRAMEETITATALGTATYTGTKCFKTITSAYFTAPATVSGADTFTGGYGNIIGIPWDIAAVGDVKNRRQDANAGVGTITIVDTRLGTWTLSAGNVPDAARRFFVRIQSTA